MRKPKMENTMMLLPANIPSAGPSAGMSAYGLYGIKDLAEMAKQAAELAPRKKSTDASCNRKIGLT